jgi:DNA anti-recombination protein RmuC
MNRPQIGISNLTSFTPESARDFATEGSDDEIIIKMLDEKAKLAEEEFDREFIHFQKKSARKPKLELREKAKLKAKFNKLSAENLNKEAKLRELKESLSRMAQLTERSQSEFDEELKNSVQDLESQCVEVESKAEDEYKQIKILKNMLSRTRLTAVFYI